MENKNINSKDIYEESEKSYNDIYNEIKSAKECIKEHIKDSIQEIQKNQESCHGCINHLAGQRDHMVEGGCLYFSDSE